MYQIPAAFRDYKISLVPAHPDTYADVLFVVCPEIRAILINTNARPDANIVRIE